MGHWRTPLRVPLLRRPRRGLRLPPQPRRTHLRSLFTETDPPLINIGTGEDVTIRELAETVFSVLGFDGALTFDHTKPDGTPRKLMDVTRLHTLGWHHTTSLDQGISQIWDLMKPAFTA